MQFHDSDMFPYGMAIKHSRTSFRGHYALPVANNVAYLGAYISDGMRWMNCYAV